MKESELVAAQYKPSYRKHIRTTFRIIRKEFTNQKLDDNAVPMLKKVEEVLAFLRGKHPKSKQQIEADMTVKDSAVGAVAGKDDDDDEEVSSGPGIIMSKPATNVRARDKSSILKNVTDTYSGKIGHITTTFGSWKRFRDSLGTDVPQQYRGTYDEGQDGLFQAIQVAKEGQKTKQRTKCMLFHLTNSFQNIYRNSKRNSE